MNLNLNTNPCFGKDYRDAAFKGWPLPLPEAAVHNAIFERDLAALASLAGRAELKPIHAAMVSLALEGGSLNDCYRPSRLGFGAAGHRPNGYWTKERCKESALKFRTRTAWEKGEGSGYQTAVRNEWDDECCAHMVSVQRPWGYWTKERCMESAARYQTRSAWAHGSRTGDGTAYNVATKNGWMEECCAHMEEVRRPNGYWTKERCIESAAQYKTRTAWQKSEGSAMFCARANGWLEECCAHMNSRPHGYWTKERCMESAAGCESRASWQRECNAAVVAARRRGWYAECTAHMDFVVKPNGYWTKERCIESARKFRTVGAWAKGDQPAHRAARQGGWYDECCAHMPRRNPAGYWTKGRCIESARKFETVGAWLSVEGGAHVSARRNGWLDECTAHMVDGRKRAA